MPTPPDLAALARTDPPAVSRGSATHAPPVYRSRLLDEALPGLRHGFTGAWPRLDDVDLARGTAALLGMGARLPWVFNQPHGADILALAEGAAPDRVPVIGYDGARARLGAADDPANSTICIKAADCVTVLAVYRGQRAYAALHAGWRGVAAGILPRLLDAWLGAPGTRATAAASDVRLAFGPHIRACCFEVRADCIAQFRAEDLDGAIVTRDGRTTLNLERVLRTQAAAYGVGEAQIEALPQCSRCTREGDAYPFASYRRAQQEGTLAGRNVAFIGPA
jgi:polyphenol oxidase